MKNLFFWFAVLLATTNLFAQSGDTETFNLYPNPTTQTVYLNTRQDIALYNQQGQRLNVYRDVDRIDVSQLPAGIYYLQNANGETQELIRQ